MASCDTSSWDLAGGSGSGLCVSAISFPKRPVADVGRRALFGVAVVNWGGGFSPAQTVPLLCSFLDLRFYSLR